MCYNCGCGKLNDDMGNPENITEKTFSEAADAAGQTIEEAKRNVLHSLKGQVQDKPASSQQKEKMKK